MRIKSRGIFMAIAFILLSLVTCIGWLIAIYDLMEDRVNSDLIILAVITVFFSFISYRAYRLTLAQNFILELNDKDFVYTFITTKSYKYSDIRKMTWYYLKGWRVESLEIIKLEFINKKSCYFRIDKLEPSIKTFLITTLRSKVRRDFNCRDKVFFY